MPQRETTLTEFIIGEQRRFPGATGGFTALVNDIRLACKRIAYAVGKGALAGMQGSAGSRNVQGEEQQKLDVLANEIFLRTNEWGGHLAGMVSEELEHPYRIPDEYPRGRYLLAFDPLDGSSNIDVNVPVGSIFSVLACPQGMAGDEERAFLQPGTRQVCAGYAIYGPTTMLVLTFGRGVHGFTLDREIGEFIYTHADLRVPEATSEFAINTSNSRFWSRRSSATATSAWRARAARAARTSTCAGSPRWWPRRTASSCAAGCSSIRATSASRAAAGGCACCMKRIRSAW